MQANLFFGGNAASRSLRLHDSLPTPAAATRCRLRFQVKSGQHPTHGAVAQRAHVGQTQAAQRRGADDTARAPGTIYDNRRAFAAVLPPNESIAAGHVVAAGNAKAAVLLRRAHIEDHQIARRALAALSTPQATISGTCAFMMDFFTECFARHIDAADGFMALPLPCGHEHRCEHGNVCVAQLAKVRAANAARSHAIVISKARRDFASRAPTRRCEIRSGCAATKWHWESAHWLYSPRSRTSNTANKPSDCQQCH